jgi:hypothetical protein
MKPETLEKLCSRIMVLDQSVTTIEQLCVRVWAFEMGLKTPADRKALQEFLSKLTVYDLMKRYVTNSLTGVSDILVIFNKINGNKNSSIH